MHGFPVWSQKKIDLPIKPDGDRNHRTIISNIQGKQAVTFIKCLEKSNYYPYLEIRPETGYTHQIRAHLSAIGMPILGDRLYYLAAPIKMGDFPPLDAFFLHALSIQFFHFGLNKYIQLKTEIPEAFQRFIQGYF